MVEYIDRQKLLKDIEQYHLSDGKFQHWVEVQPSADVQPVRRGHWEKIGKPTWWGLYECSECHKICSIDYPYCPHCGSRMKEESNDTENS